MIKRYSLSPINRFLVEDLSGDLCKWSDVNNEYDIDGNTRKAWRMKKAEAIREIIEKYQEYLICDRGNVTSRMADTIAQYAMELKNHHNTRGV